MNRLMKFFKFSHLPEPMRDISIWCFELALKMDQELVDSAELTAGLRKLLEAKDCFVRARLEELEDEASENKDGPA